MTGHEPTIEGGAVPLPDVPHGTLGGYSYHGCSCQACRAANRDHQRRHRARTDIRCKPGLGWPLRVPPRPRP